MNTFYGFWVFFLIQKLENIEVVIKKLHLYAFSSKFDNEDIFCWKLEKLITTKFDLRIDNVKVTWLDGYC